MKIKDLTVPSLHPETCDSILRFEKALCNALLKIATTPEQKQIIAKAYLGRIKP